MTAQAQCGKVRFDKVGSNEITRGIREDWIRPDEVREDRKKPGYIRED